MGWPFNPLDSLNIPKKPTFRKTTDLAVKDILPGTASKTAPTIPCQIHRTITKKGTGPSGIPDIVRKDVLEGYVAAIAQASDYIYIENQYFREKEVADAIISQHKAKPDLRTIIVIPKVIEEFLKSKGDELSKHGAALQFELFESMKKAIGANLGLFAMVRKDNILIYVHSKLVIIDDKFTSIGSANCNPRIFRVDTELEFRWYSETIAKDLRLNLWNEMLGSPSTLNTWSSKDYVKKWSKIAKKNITGKAADQKGFVIPFDNNNKGEKSPVPGLSNLV